MKMLGKHVLAAAIAATALFPPATAMAQDLFGAIAYSPSSRAFGWAKDFGSQYEAENAAMNECYKRAGDCRVAVWFQNACGSVASGPEGWGADWGESFREAERKATRLCSDYSHGCAIVTTQCVSNR